MISRILFWLGTWFISAALVLRVIAVILVLAFVAIALLLA